MKRQEQYSISLALEEITKEMDIIIGQEVNNLYKDLVKVSIKIRDTGAFQRGFTAPKKVGKYGWEFKNTADHSIVLAQGRHTINGKDYGSLRWYNGLSPMLDKIEATMIKRFEEVKR